MESVSLLEKIRSGLLYVVIFLIPWHTAYIISDGSIPFLGAHDAASITSQYLRILITPLDLVVLGVLLISLPRILRRLSSFTKPSFGSIALGFFAFFAIISVFYNVPNFHTALFYSVRLTEGFVLFVMFRGAHFDIRKAGTTFVCAGVVQSALAFWQFFLQEVTASSWLGMAAHSAATLGTAVVEGAAFRLLRAYGSFPHPNVLAGFLGVSLAWGMYMIVTAQTRRIRIYFTLSSLLILLGFLFTFSRGAMIAFVSAIFVSWLIVLFFSNNRRSLSVLRILGIISCALLGIFFLAFREPLMVRSGLQGNARLETRSFDERALYIRQAFDMIAKHPFGVGIGQYVPTLIQHDIDSHDLKPAYTYQPVHNLFLLILAELGYQGLIALFLFLTSILIYIWKAWRSNGSIPFLYCSSIVIVFLCISALTDHYYWTLQSGVFLWWISLGLASRST